MSKKQMPSFDPQTPSEQALAAVAAAGADGERLIQAWRDAGNAAALVEVAEEGAGPVRKAARRALGVLRSRGVPIPEKRHIARLVQTAEETTEAWLATPDGSFQLVIALARWPKARRGKVVFAQLGHGVGLLGLRLAEIAQSGFKTEARRLLGERVRLVSIPVPWARARIAEARALSAERGLPPPLGLSSAAELLDPTPDGSLPHPFDALGFELTSEDLTALIETSARLHGLPEFASWLPTRDAVQSLLVEVGKGLTPGAQPGEEKMNQHVREEIRSATDRYFSPERRELLVLAMKDGALGVLAREGKAKAREVAAAIRAIEQRGLITDPPHEVPFLRGFFEKALQVLMAQNQGQLRIPVPSGAQGSAPTGGGPSTEDTSARAESSG